MRLIDADALKEALGECPENWTDTAEEVQAENGWRAFMRIIDSMPTIKPFKPLTINHGIFDYDAECSALNEE